MNRAIAIIVAAVVILSVVLASIGISNATAPTGMTVICYDADGNKVWEEATDVSGIDFGFQNTAGVIASVSVKVTYTVSGHDDGSVISVQAVERVVCTSEYAPDPSVSALKTTPGNGWTDSLSTAQHVTSWPSINDLVTRNMKGDEYGYILYFYCTLTATATVEGVSSSVELPLVVVLHIWWVEPQFTIVGGIDFA